MPPPPLFPSNPLLKTEVLSSPPTFWKFGQMQNRNYTSLKIYVHILIRVLLQKWFNIISKMIVLITYHAQISPKWFLAVIITPRYIAFILTENWFGQDLDRNWKFIWYGMLVKCMEFLEKIFFSKFQPFLLFWERLKCYFGFLAPKLIKVPIFMNI